MINILSMEAHMRFPLIWWSGYNASKMAQLRIFEMLRFEHPDGMTDGKLAAQFCC